MDDLRILLVSPDLMATSRVAALGREHGARVETLRSLDGPAPDGPCDVVLLDLQGVPGDAAVIVSQLRSVVGELQGDARGDSARATLPRLVAFGPHVARQRLDDAVAAGADEAISRGELLGSFPALVRRWRG